MKKQRKARKLELSRETLRRLENDAYGGDDDVVDPSVVITCFPYSFWCATAGCGA